MKDVGNLENAVARVAEGSYDKRNSLISSTSEQCDLPRIKRLAGNE
jgi:hypothetical protein